MRSIPSMRIVVAVLIACVPWTLSCAGRSVYVAPGTTTQSLSFSDTDIQMMATAMYGSLQQRLDGLLPAGSPKPVVALLHIANKTSEHIDTDIIADKLQINMITAGTLRFVDRSKIRAISQEFDLGGSGMVNPETAKRAGSVLGADFLLAGDMSSIVKTSGRSQLSYYRLSMRLLQVETDEVVWADEYELKKAGSKGILDW